MDERDTPVDGYTVSVGYVRALLSYVSQQGIDPSEFCTPHELRQWEAMDSSARCGLFAWEDLMRRAEACTGQPYLALAMSSEMKPRHAGLMGFLAMTSGTLRDVGTAVARFHHLLNDLETVKTYVEDRQFVMDVHQMAGAKSQRLVLVTLGSWIWYARWLTGCADIRFDVDLMQPAPNAMGQTWGFVGGDIRFGQARNALRGDMAYLALPVAQQEPHVNRILQIQAEEQLQRLSSRSGSFLVSLERLLKRHLNQGDVHLAAVASELNMSPRTLQSRLETSGMSFRGLVDRVRQSEAESYLKESSLPLIEIALRLGFSNQTSFQHAFKRWTGKSPGEFRREVA